MTTTLQLPAAPPSPAGHQGTPDAENVDVLFLAGQRPAEDAEWLLITEVDGLPGSVFSAWVLPAGGRQGRGGDVLVRLAPGTRTGDLEPETIDVSAWAVISRRLIPVAAWDRQDLDGWPERIRQTVAFAMGILTELEEHYAAAQVRLAGCGASRSRSSARSSPETPRRLPTATYSETTSIRSATGTRPERWARDDALGQRPDIEPPPARRAPATRAMRAVLQVVAVYKDPDTHPSTHRVGNGIRKVLQRSLAEVSEKPGALLLQFGHLCPEPLQVEIDTC